MKLFFVTYLAGQQRADPLSLNTKHGTIFNVQQFLRIQFTGSAFTNKLNVQIPSIHLVLVGEASIMCKHLGMEQ